METLTAATIATLLLTKMIEKLGEMAGEKLPDLGEAVWEQVENLKQKLWHNDPDTARAIELVTYQPDLLDRQPQDYGLEVLAGKIELAAAADPELAQMIEALAAFVRKLFDGKFDGKFDGEGKEYGKKPLEPPLKNTVRLVATPQAKPIVSIEETKFAFFIRRLLSLPSIETKEEIKTRQLISETRQLISETKKLISETKKLISETVPIVALTQEEPIVLKSLPLRSCQRPKSPVEDVDRQYSLSFLLSISETVNTLPQVSVSSSQETADCQEPINQQHKEPIYQQHKEPIYQQKVKTQGVGS